MTNEKYDLIVIGSGPAGEKGAAAASYFGKKVALIERESVLGGAAANTGTIPSKTLRETALFLSNYRQRDLYGIHFSLKEKLSVRDFMSRERLVKENERARILENLRHHHVTLYRGNASFVDPHTVAVKPVRCPDCLLQADVILVATGSYPYRPTSFPFHDPRIYDSDTILTLQDVPGSMAVVGGGVIGCEYACMFAALGVEITIIERRHRLAGFLDDEIAEILRARMEANGCRVIFNDQVEIVKNAEKIELLLKSGSIIAVDTVLVSSGRCGNTEALGLDKVGVGVSERGHITVNEHFQTNLPHVYAAGDVIGNPALASTAMEQARMAMVHAFNFRRGEVMCPILPSGLYTIPECSMAGETEESLREKQIPYIEGKALYAKNARGQIIGDTQGMLKLLFHEATMKLLGVHVIGESATEIIHVGLTALVLGADAKIFIETCYNYPTLTEMYKYATYDALGRRDFRLQARPSPEREGR